VRVLGLDVGEKTIGVAVSDELGLAAHPVRTVARRGTAADAQEVADLCRELAATEVVCGLPLALDGTEGPAVRRVRAFTRALAARLGEAVPIHEWDERFSTALAERVLIEADFSRRRRKQVVDRQAAVIILQGWLDARRGSE
jgi:putative holliday junction resolvase